MTTTIINRLLILSLSIIMLSGCDKIVDDLDDFADQLTGASTGANKLTGNLANQKVGGLSYIEIAPGKIRFAGTMDNGGNSGHNFEVSLQLEDDKEARFYFFATKRLDKAIQLNITKEDTKALITLTINDVSHNFEKDLTVNNRLDLSIDVHNDHEDAHILMWNTSGPFGDTGECVFDDECIYNTESYTPPEDGPWGSQGKGPGSFWGFEGDKDMIIKVRGPLRPLSDV